MKYLFVILLIACFHESKSQGTDKKSVAKIVSFLNFKDDERVADIGSGDLKRITEIASCFPNTFFTLEDIDSTSCNWNNLKKQLRKNKNKIDASKFQIIIGDINDTKLNADDYNDITIFSSLHEFSDKHSMLQEIKTNLKKSGLLYIFEDITSDTISLKCPNGSYYFQSTRFNSLLKSEGIQIIEQKIILEDPDLREIIFKCTFMD